MSRAIRSILAHARAPFECDLTPKIWGASTDRVDSCRIYLIKYIDARKAQRHGRGDRDDIIRAQRLTTFSVAADGSSVSLGVADEEGRTGALMLPTACLKELMMTLPEMMRRALRLQHDDPSLRLVYHAAGWDVERSTVPETLIVTLRTVDGFHVSFALTEADSSDMANSTDKPTLDADRPSAKLRRVH